MIPSKNWFPTNLQDRAAWYDNFDSQVQSIGTTVGLTAPDLASIDDDNAVLQFLADAAVTIKAYAAAERNYRKIITEGDIGDVTPAFPSNINLTLPKTIETGMFERLDTYVNRIRASANYTAEIGALLGIISSHPVPLAPEDMKPVISAESFQGSVVQVKFVRGRSDGVNIETLVDKGDWTSQGFFFKSPAPLNIPANEAGSPRNVQIRARYLDGNTPVGQASDVVTVQTIP